MRALLAFLTIILSAAAVSAAPRINGSTGYAFSKDMSTITLSMGMVDNSASAARTGTLQVKLWATAAPHRGGAISGYLLGSFKLEPLQAGHLYRDLKKVVPYVPPSVKGTYYLTMTLTEYDGSKYVTVDYRNMQKTVALAPLRTFTFTAPWRWQTNYANKTISLEVGKIAHRKTGRTGSLKVSVWATKTPFRGGQVNGWELGRVVKDGLEPGYSYSNFKAATAFTPPPDGTYFVTIMLSEYTKEGYRMMEYLTSADAHTFSAP